VPRECNLHAYGMWFNNASVASGQGLQQLLSMPDCKTMSFTVVAGKAYAVNYVRCLNYSRKLCTVFAKCIYVCISYRVSRRPRVFTRLCAVLKASGGPSGGPLGGPLG
jgi:hypothetical protein